MDIARSESVMRNKRMRRYMYRRWRVLAGGRRHGRAVAPEAGCAQRGPLDDLYRYREAQRHASRRTRPRHTRAETILVIPAATDGRVDKRYLLPGTLVKADTVIMDLTDPQLQQEVLDAQFQVKGAEASLEQTRATLQNQLMDKRTQAARSARNTALPKCKKKPKSNS